MKHFAWIAVVLLGLAGAGGGWWAGLRGLETCGWLDRALGRSGCVEVLRFDGILPSRGNLNVPFDDRGRVILVAEMRTVDGWRNGLIVLDPLTGREGGRYPLPMRHDNLRLFAEPDGSRLLLLCGVVEARCSDSGGNAVMAERATLRTFSDDAIGDRYLRAFPGTPLPDETFGYKAVFAAGGDRIVSESRNQPLLLLDAAGREISVLSERGIFSSEIIVSPDGTKITRWEPQSSPSGGDVLRIWNAADGRELHRIEGSAGWRLRAPPFWSADGDTIFAPRYARGTMFLDRFVML